MQIVVACFIGLLLSVRAGAESVVSGQVRFADGQPVGGAEVMLFHTSDETLEVVAETTTDESGHFALALTAALATTAGSAQPARFHLGQSYPNPFNPSTLIPYELAATARVRLDVFNLLGQRVVTLVDDEQVAGSYTARWDARDAVGHGVASGVYIYRLTVTSTSSADGAMATGRMVLVDGAAGKALPAGAMGAGPVSGAVDGVDALNASAVASRTEMPVYGLAVGGDGLETYVDSAFVVGTGPVDVVLDGAAGKAVAQQDNHPAIGWAFKDINLSDEEVWNDDLFFKLVNEQKGKCKDGAEDQSLTSTQQNGFRVYEMSLSLYDCYSGMDTDLYDILIQTLKNVAIDITVLVGVIGVTAGTKGLAAPVAIPIAMMKAAKIYSAYTDLRLALRYRGVLGEKIYPSTRIYLMGPQTQKGKLLPWADYLPIFMVRYNRKGEKTIPLKLFKNHYSLPFFHEESASFGDVSIKPYKGYIIIPPKIFYISVDETSMAARFNRKVSFQLHPGYKVGLSIKREHKQNISDIHFLSVRPDMYETKNQVVLSTIAGEVIASGHSMPSELAKGLPDWNFKWYFETKYSIRRELLFEGSMGAINKNVFFDGGDKGKVTIILEVESKDDAITWSREYELGVRTDLRDDVCVERFEPYSSLLCQTPELSTSSTSLSEVEETGRFFSLPGAGEMEMVKISGGNFMMGSPSSEVGHISSEGPVHQVSIAENFWLSKYEVTQGQWEAVMGTRPWSGKSNVVENPSHPAVYISWNDVQAFIDKLNEEEGEAMYRLPTEAEWEYACRDQASTRWSFGDDASGLEEYAWYDENAWNMDKKYAQAVGLLFPNRWGLYDMHGNVYEWVLDWYDKDYYAISPSDDPQGPTSGSYRVVRGGSFYYKAQALRSAARASASPDLRDYDIGVRLLRKWKANE